MTVTTEILKAYRVTHRQTGEELDVVYAGECREAQKKAPKVTGLPGSHLSVRRARGEDLEVVNGRAG